MKTNQEYVNEWLLELKNVEKRPEDTVKQYKININLFIKYLDSVNKNVVEVTMIDVRGFFGANEWKVNTCLVKQATIRTFYNWMSDEERYMIKSPIKEIKFSKEERQPKYLKPEKKSEVINFLDERKEDDFISERDYILFVFMLNSGVRRKEVAIIKIEDLDLNGETATVKVIRKGNKEKYIPLPDHLRKKLKQYIKNNELKSENYLFSKIKNGEYKQLCVNSINTIVKKVKNKTGVNMTPHTLRHTYATDMMEFANLREVQELLGHSSSKTTEVYTHNNAEKLSRVVQNLK